MCRSPRMSPSSISSGSSPLAGRLQLAAVLAQLRRDALHAQPLVDLLLGRAGVRSRRSRRRRCRTRSRAARACTASVRSASLCLPEPVKCWSRLPNASSGTMRRSTGRPDVRHAPARPPRRTECTTSIAGEPAERLDQRRRVARGGDDVEVLARVGPAAGAARQLDRGRGRVVAQRRDQLARPTASALESRMRASALPSAPAASAASTFSSAFLPKPGTSSSRPVLGRLAQLVERVTPRCSCSSAHPLGPEPRDARDLHQAGRDLAP